MNSYTSTKLIQSEQQQDLRSALIQLLVPFIPLEGPLTVVRTDPAPGFHALVNDELLRKFRIQIEEGRSKNTNKNPVAERAVQELEEVIRKMDSHGEALNDYSLALATARLNSKVRSNGLSAREILIQRDQFTNNNIPISDRNIILEKHTKALKDQESSEKIQAESDMVDHQEIINVGDLVHMYDERDKHHPRSRYIVTSVDKPWLQIRKFTNNQLRSLPYRVKVNDVYKVPSQLNIEQRHHITSEDDDPQPLLPSADSQVVHSVAEYLPDKEPSTSTLSELVDIPEEIACPPCDKDLGKELPSAESSDAPIIHQGRPPRDRRPPGYLKDYET